MATSLEDLIVWPCGTWCFRSELHEFSHKSDDYMVYRITDPNYQTKLNELNPEH